MARVVWQAMSLCFSLACAMHHGAPFPSTSRSSLRVLNMDTFSSRRRNWRGSAWRERSWQRHEAEHLRTRMYCHRWWRHRIRERPMLLAACVAYSYCKRAMSPRNGSSQSVVFFCVHCGHSGAHSCIGWGPVPQTLSYAAAH